MRRLVLAAVLATTISLPVAQPAMAQNSAADARFDAAQARFDREMAIYRAELDRYRQMRNDYRGAGGYRGPTTGYDDRSGGYSDDRAYSDDRDEGNYDPARYYRDGSNYQERRLAADDRVYRGSDGRYYCRRSDGTTGLIVGAAAGGILGNVIDGGHSRTAGTLIGAAAGALAGKSIDQNNSDIRCR